MAYISIKNDIHNPRPIQPTSKIREINSIQDHELASLGDNNSRLDINITGIPPLNTEKNLNTRNTSRDWASRDELIFLCNKLNLFEDKISEIERIKEETIDRSPINKTKNLEDFIDEATSFHNLHIARAVDNNRNKPKKPIQHKRAMSVKIGENSGTITRKNSVIVEFKKKQNSKPKIVQQDDIQQYFLKSIGPKSLSNTSYNKTFLDKSGKTKYQLNDTIQTQMNSTKKNSDSGLNVFFPRRSSVQNLKKYNEEYLQDHQLDKRSKSDMKNRVERLKNQINKEKDVKNKLLKDNSILIKEVQKQTDFIKQFRSKQKDYDLLKKRRKRMDDTRSLKQAGKIDLSELFKNEGFRKKVLSKKSHKNLAGYLCG